MLRVSPLALGAWAYAPCDISRVRLTAASRMRRTICTAITSRLIRPLTRDLCPAAYLFGEGRQTGLDAFAAGSPCHRGAYRRAASARRLRSTLIGEHWGQAPA